jgi:hypothetical protein
MFLIFVLFVYAQDTCNKASLSNTSYIASQAFPFNVGFRFNVSQNRDTLAITSLGAFVSAGPGKE